jgi:hypothetical protein
MFWVLEFGRSGVLFCNKKRTPDLFLLKQLVVRLDGRGFVVAESDVC